MTLSAGARKWTIEEYRAVLKEYRNGARQCDIAKSLGLSSGSVRQIIRKATFLEIHGLSEYPFDTLNARARNCLIGAGLLTIDAVRAALAEGRLGAVPNIGKGTKYEIQIWLDSLGRQE